MQMDKIKVGIIGSLSFIAEKHIEALKNLESDFDFYGVCDLDENRIRDQAFKYEIPFWTDYKEMLEYSEIDLYVVAVPNHLHRKIGQDVAKAGKDALIEKPITTNLRDADKLIKIFKKKKRNLFVMLQMRFHPALCMVKQAIDEGKLGRILGSSLNIFWFRSGEYFQKSTWKGVKKLEGGSLLNQGIHYIDIMQWLVGPVESVFARIFTLFHKIETEDTVQAILKFKNPAGESGIYSGAGGASGTLNFNIFTYPKNFECSLTIFGTQGTIKIGGEKMQEIKFWDVKNYPMPPIKKTAYILQTYVYADIAQSLRRGLRAEISGGEARKSLEIIEAIYRSAKENKEIRFPL
ncbi:MAG: hypothetical protein COX91_02795 [Candidatus Nealsonbacteria bacterium CG_4_10_14_0_2_um_filter_39_15]|uniref:Gfo/Idh/MocA family oxidoreductase n=1 Tax=Candidatus Nealsonbacteria bacterium CG_4_10_14_0_2_um_filter_39_15 TaxID=1974681 RepID=A0A2M7UVE8_9BACT|nr:MAG: hypothetical protein COX91_02795 [Candidatus Nealsonbacteria bacterium CG_4_10_14_0_2_um_filter_39_15]